MKNEYLTAKEVAEQLRVSLPVVYAMYKDGRLGGYTVGEKTIRFTQKQVNACMEGAKKARSEK